MFNPVSKVGAGFNPTPTGMGNAIVQSPQHRRKTLRLPGYDYSQPGGYFVTIVTNQRQCLFGDVSEGDMHLSSYGHIVMQCWNDLVRHYPHVRRDEFVVMPNHVHGILVLNDVGAGFKPAPTTQPSHPYKRHGLPEIVRGFKTFSAKRINRLRSSPGIPVWQRNYYEHVIRSEAELGRVREYIQNNPAQWDLDKENPSNVNYVGAGSKPAPTQPY